MNTPRSALKFDLFAQAGRKRKLEEVGDPLQVIAKHTDFNELVVLVRPFLARGEGSKGGRPAYLVDVMVRVLVLKQLYNLSDEQMEYQLLDGMSYQRFCLLEHSLNVPDRNTIWRFGQSLGIDGAGALFEGAELQKGQSPDWSQVKARQKAPVLDDLCAILDLKPCLALKFASFEWVKRGALWGFTKVRYRGLTKNTTRSFVGAWTDQSLPNTRHLGA